MVPVIYSRGKCTHYFDRFHDFSGAIRKCHKNDYDNSFFPRTARLWNSLSAEYFPLTYHLHTFKSVVNRGRYPT